MKNNLLFAMAVAIVFASCNKTEEAKTITTDNISEREIIFRAEGPGLEITTKAASETTLENLTSFTAMATTGSLGSQQQKWKTTANKNAQRVFGTEKYWPSSSEYYSFYGANVDLSAMEATPSGGVLSVANTDIDIVYACSILPQFGKSPVSLTFRHAFSRLGTMTVTMSASGYELAVNEIKLCNVYHSGSLNMQSKAWSDKGSARDETIRADGSDNDLWMVPGEYDLKVRYTLTKGDFSEVYDVTKKVTFEEGRIMNINAQITQDPAKPITFDITVTAWEGMAGLVIL